MTNSATISLTICSIFFLLGFVGSIKAKNERRRAVGVLIACVFQAASLVILALV